MPIYEYCCTKCGHHLEVMQSIHAKPLRRCKECSGRLEKLVSRTSFQLKGGGWYDSGYSKSSGGKAESGSAKSGSKDSAGGDKKTAGKSEKKEAKAASA